MVVPTGIHEDPLLWRKLHNLWISEIYQCLKPQVAGRFSLSIDQEVTMLEIGEVTRRLRPDLRSTEGSPLSAASAGEPSQGAKKTAGAVAYAEGVEAFSTESRHFIVLQDLEGKRVIAVLEVLSPTNKGFYSRFGLDSFEERRKRLLGSDVSYMEIDALSVGSRWLPRCLADLTQYAGVAWFSIPGPGGRLFRGWAWQAEGPLPAVPWDLGDYGIVNVDLATTLREALLASGLAGGA